jgi:hypothetical protein
MITPLTFLFASSLQAPGVFTLEGPAAEGAPAQAADEAAPADVDDQGSTGDSAAPTERPEVPPSAPVADAFGPQLPPTSPAPAPFEPPPQNGSGLIIGGSMLTGLGPGLVLIGGVLTLFSGSPAPFAVMGSLGAASIGGGIAMEVIGFRRLDTALDWERRHQHRQAMSIGGMWGVTVPVGFLVSGGGGLISGIVTSAVYTARVNKSRRSVGMASRTRLMVGGTGDGGASFGIAASF